MAAINDTKFRQDMPPEGGYGRIFVQRTFPRINSKTGTRIAAAITILFFGGYFKYRAFMKAHMRFQIENNDVRMVTEAFHTAERDRMWLNHIRKLRDQERELMKDVPGWRVGTFYGEPIFYTLPPDHWWDPQGYELLAHSSYYNSRYLANWRVDSDMKAGPKWYDKYLPEWLVGY